MLKFIIRETFLSIKKAKGSFLISLISTGISIFLVTVSYFLFDFSGAVQKTLKENVTLNVFINDRLSPESTELLKQEILKLEYVSGAILTSKEEAADNFIRETGEDFRKILDYNPLPASFKVFINDKYFSSANLRRAFNDISRIDGVDDVIYKNETAETVLKIIEYIKKYVAGAAIILILISIYIIYSTSRLILKARSDEMETMKLIGAKISAIKMPVILSSFFTSLLSGLLSLIIFSLFIRSLEDYISDQFSYSLDYYFLLSVTILSGPILGVIISYLSLRKITLKF
jgi:cell division transport system permease protein